MYSNMETRGNAGQIEGKVLEKYEVWLKCRKELNIWVRRQKNDTWGGEWMIGKAQEATCTSHQDQKFQHLHKIAVGKKKKKKFAKKKKFPVTVVFSFLHSPCFPSPSDSSLPFNLCYTLAYTFLPRLCVPPPFFLHPSISPSPLMSPSALPLFLHATPFWERTGPGLGC